uniref:Uncharacterized protein n=1 Tax=Rhizophora mucronata TaxID=61149 RepID=A0A2P2PQZ6_RHIMU
MAFLSIRASSSLFNFLLSFLLITQNMQCPLQILCQPA